MDLGGRAGRERVRRHSVLDRSRTWPVVVSAQERSAALLARDSESHAEGGDLATMANAEQLFESFNSNESIDRVVVDITFGDDGIDAGNHIPVILRNVNDGPNLDVGTVPTDGVEVMGRSHESLEQSVSDASSLPALERVRLEWKSMEGGDPGNDDCDVSAVAVRFFAGAECKHRSVVTRGKRAASADFFDFDARHWMYQTLPMRLQAGYRAGDGFETEESQPVFEGWLHPPLVADVQSATPDNFDAEWQVSPEAFDLAKALALQTDQLEP
jgi:hypothetical protein